MAYSIYNFWDSGDDSWTPTAAPKPAPAPAVQAPPAPTPQPAPAPSPTYGTGGGSRDTGIQATSTPVNVASNLPTNASYYNAPAQFEGQDFNVGLNAVSWANVQKNVAGGMNFNEAVIRASGDGIGTRVVMPSDSGYLPYGVDVVTGQPVYGGAGPGGGSAGGSSGGGIIGGSMGAGSNSQFTPWNVTSPQTVQGQTAGIIASDSPLMQQARGRAMQQMNERGLINSSLAAQAAQDAVMDRAIQIGSQDASTNASSAQFNANQQNAWNLAQQEFDYKRWALMQDFENQKQLQEVESKYNQQLNSDANFQKQYAMYIETLFQIDMNTALDPETKLQMKKQRAQELDDYIAINKLGINMDFSDYWDAKIGAAPTPTPAPTAPYVDTSGA